jgi:hypothetical protein
MQKSLDKRGIILIETYWHNTYTYGLFRMFKVSASCTDTFSYLFGTHEHTRKEDNEIIICAAFLLLNFQYQETSASKG